MKCLNVNKSSSLLIAFCVFYAYFTHATIEAVVDLTKQLWTLSNKTTTIENVKMPSGVYSALHGEDVLQSYNDVNLRWIAYDNWTYSLTFFVNRDDFNSANHVNLTFYGIDTVAEIRLNGYLLGRTNNMFVRYSYSVQDKLLEENVLEVEIKSPISAALERAERLNELKTPVPPDCPSPSYKGECHMNMLRKMQASFSWDWGLAAPSMGVWKDVMLEVYESALLRDIDVVTSRNATHWNMHISVYMETGDNRNFYAELTFYAVELLKTPVVISEYRKKPINAKAPVITFDQAVPIEDVTLWWPNGYGEQKLYPLHFTLKAWSNLRGPQLRSKITSQRSIRVGFRTLELVEQPAPADDGNTFLFKVNGVEMFMKGTNYIPAHILPELGTRADRVQYLLLAARDAHMNMIRVWGGGTYESDDFYNAADDYGLLIWQDMMFACAMYPVEEDFLETVRVETQQNAKRLAYHPSVAIFATNNENEAALVQNWYRTRYDHARFEEEYRTLYLGTVMHELKIVGHSSRPQPLVSSPSNGKEEASYNYISPDPQDPHYGDVHFYDIARDAWDPSIYPRPRFASEYGFQSLPKWHSWNLTMADGDDFIALMNHRQHHPAGMLPILNLVRIHLPLPLPEDAGYAEALIYFSQIAQAMATKTETELYRSLRDTDVRTMGALYWQLNDVWVAPSWSSIDFYGNYKLLHHWAKEFMAPIAIIALYSKDHDTINVTLACDQLEVYSSTELQVNMNKYHYSELYPAKTISWPATLRPNGVQYDKVIKLDEIFIDGFTRQNAFLEFQLLNLTSNKILSTTYHFPSRISTAVGVRDPKIECKISLRHCSSALGISKHSYTLTVTVQYPALFVYIEVRHPLLKRYKLSRNGYMQLAPIEVVHLEFEHSSCFNDTDGSFTMAHIELFTVNQYMI